MNNNIKHIIYGAIIGIANIIPGVSGGTMAVILNVYDKLIKSVSNWRKDFVNSMKFLIPIGLGAGIGILLFSKIIEYCLANFSVATNLVFIGLIVGSIPMILRKTREQKMGISEVLSLLVCLALMLYMGFANPDDSANQVITTLSVASFLKIFAVSFISAGAMIIPGVSGSFVMLLLGMYTTVLTAISNLNIMILIPVCLGCGVGILVCAKIIDVLFTKFPQQTYSGILGLMIGSLFVIFPAFTLNIEFVIGAILAVVFAIVAYMFSKN
ncbi:MAG: DUF368 domain-containing protein [Eubacteriales bacterium]